MQGKLTPKYIDPRAEARHRKEHQLFNRTVREFNQEVKDKGVTDSIYGTTNQKGESIPKRKAGRPVVPVCISIAQFRETLNGPLTKEEKCFAIRVARTGDLFKSAIECGFSPGIARNATMYLLSKLQVVELVKLEEARLKVKPTELSRESILDNIIKLATGASQDGVRLQAWSKLGELFGLWKDDERVLGINSDEEALAKVYETLARYENIPLKQLLDTIKKLKTPSFKTKSKTKKTPNTKEIGGGI